MTMQTTHNSTPAIEEGVEFVVSRGGGGRPESLGAGPVLGKLARIAKAPEGQYGPNMYWYWELFYTHPSDPKDVFPASFNPDGSVYQFREITSVKFGKGKVTAKARERAEALLKRDIDDESENLREVMNSLIGKPAILYLVENERGYLDVKMVERYDPKRVIPAPVIDEPEPETAFAGEDAPPF